MGIFNFLDMKETIIVGVLRLVFVLAFVFLLHAFIFADARIFNWHWLARLSFVVVSSLLFGGLYKADKVNG